MALTYRGAGTWKDTDPFEGVCAKCGEPIFRPGGNAWSHDDGWLDDDHKPEPKEG